MRNATTTHDMLQIRDHGLTTSNLMIPAQYLTQAK